MNEKNPTIPSLFSGFIILLHAFSGVLSVHAINPSPAARGCFLNLKYSRPKSQSVISMIKPLLPPYSTNHSLLAHHPPSPSPLNPSVIFCRGINGVLVQ